MKEYMKKKKLVSGRVSRRGGKKIWEKKGEPKKRWVRGEERSNEIKGTTEGCQLRKHLG